MTIRTLRRAMVLVATSLTAIFTLPAVASACTLPGSADLTMTPLAPPITGTVPSSMQGDFVQIPFPIPSGTRAIRVRYCYDGGSTIDMGVYEPLHAGDSLAGPAERRGWSGSAVKDLAISEDGFSPESTYLPARKAYVTGYTTRAYQPGPIAAGTWTVELGLAALGNPNVGYEVQVETSSDGSTWANNPYSPAPYSSAAANTNPGWYAGDVHTHGEMEPGNATMHQSFDYAFKSLADGGAGLDFLGLVDHNNDVNQGEIGRYQASYPGKLIIPGTEVTTYHGHYNNIGSNYFADFRGGPIYTLDTATMLMTKASDGVVPASQFGGIQAGGGWTQVNHPTIFPSSTPGFAALCRGCPWDWTDAQTDYSKVDAIELQTGPADIGPNLNPFTLDAIAFYEQKLATGAHIAAVGSSDSHQADQTDVTTAPIGRATTVVHAGELSKAAIIQGIRDDHTYVKFYGNDGPDIRVTAHSPGAVDATIGETIAGPSLSLDVEVLKAGAGATRPGTYEVELVKDGVVADKATITSDDFKHTFTTTDAARYSIEVIRDEPDANRPEVYSSPVWYEQATNLKLGKLKLNKKKGTATLEVTVAGPGQVSLKGKSLKSSKKTATAAGKLKLTVKPKGKLARKLADKGKAKVKAKVSFAPTGGATATANKSLKLKRK